MKYIELLSKLNKGENIRDLFFYTKEGNSYTINNVFLFDRGITFTGYSNSNTFYFQNIGELKELIQNKYEGILSHNEISNLNLEIEWKLFENNEIEKIENSIGEIIIYEKRNLINKITGIFK